jgi:hypothetical protein
MAPETSVTSIQHRWYPDKVLLTLATVKASDVTKSVTHVRFEVFTAVTMKKGVFWGVMLCGSCKNRRFEGTWRFLHQGDKNLWNTKYLVFLRSVRRLLVAACVVPSSPIFVTLMKEAQVPPKRLFLQEPHCVTTQKTPFFSFLVILTRLSGPRRAGKQTLGLQVCS